MSDHQQWQHRTDGPYDGPSEPPAGSPGDRVVPGTVLGGSRYERIGYGSTEQDTAGHGTTEHGSTGY
ncbi:hypothetical protein, partial [Streptomyces sp. NRRL S-495]|uniref:hypothetical protein n=1 Tax=Streptomyces sp. NRRL S-495 TaxID=1609133 RepID=UPI0005F982DA